MPAGPVHKSSCNSKREAYSAGMAYVQDPASSVLRQALAGNPMHRVLLIGFTGAALLGHLQQCLLQPVRAGCGIWHDTP